MRDEEIEKEAEVEEENKEVQEVEEENKEAQLKQPEEEIKHEEDESNDVSADGLVRLQKIIADRGFCSRRKAEDYITAGKVKVNHKVVDKLGSSFDPNCYIEVDGYPLARVGQKVYLAVNKPLGFICTASDPRDRKLVTQLVPPQYGRVFPIGRLDINSEGLILLTNDGDFANLVMHPSSSPDKVYEVKINKRLTKPEIEQLRNGIPLEDGMTSPAQVREAGISIYNCTYEITIHEGRNREIRRMMEYLGKRVYSLKRISIGNIGLKDMPRGSYREVPLKVVEQMRADCMTRKKNNDLQKVMEEKKKAALNAK